MALHFLSEHNGPARAACAGACAGPLFISQAVGELGEASDRPGGDLLDVDWCSLCVELTDSKRAKAPQMKHLEESSWKCDLQLGKR